MKRFILLLLCLVCLVPAGCASRQGTEDDGTLHILATTYPVYLFTKSVTANVEGVEVTRLISEEVSCLHDYTLTVTDMKAIERADIIILNGAGLEDFMSDALAQSSAAVIDCSENIELLETPDHESDPHFWLDKNLSIEMIYTIRDGLCELDEAHADAYMKNLFSAVSLLTCEVPDASALSCPYLITFHDGFQYFAQSTGLTLLKAIEEEEGSEASAAEIREIVALIGEYDIPAIFTEKNGSDSTAQAIARETGVAVCQLDMVMSGEGEDITAFSDAMSANYAVIQEALG